MIDLPGLLSVAVAFLIVAASPGPANLAIATISMGSGRRHGMRFGIGLSLGLAFWGLIAATGIGALLQASTIALIGLKIVGGVYLLWLAFGSFRSACKKHETASTKRFDGNLMRRGLLLNLANPKAVVAWMATLSLGVSGEHGMIQVLVATGLCIALGFLNYAFYAFFFSTNGAMQTYARLRRWIDGAISALFAAAGIGLIRSAISR